VNQAARKAWFKRAGTWWTLAWHGPGRRGLVGYAGAGPGAAPAAPGVRPRRRVCQKRFRFTARW